VFFNITTLFRVTCYVVSIAFDNNIESADCIGRTTGW